MNSFSDIFELMKNSLEITDTARKLWIDPIKPVKLNNNKVVLYISDDYVKHIVEENYSNIFKAKFKDILGFDVEIEFISDDTTGSESTSITTGQKVLLSEPIPELQDDPYIKDKLQQAEINGNYQHTFDTFIVGESNRLACAACKAIAQGQARNYNPLYIYSEPGLGKTHLLCAVKNEILLSHPEYNIVFVSAETFVNEFVNSVRNNLTEEFKKKYRSADMFLVDDVQFFSGKRESQNELFHTFNDLHSAGKQIILTSDRPPKEINDIEERLLTRFEWGLLADIAPPEFETRLAIIKRKAELLNMRMPNNVMEYMADKLKNNIRQIEGAIVKMNAMSMLTESVPTLMMAQNIIRDVMTEQQPVPVTVEKVITEVSHIFNVSPEEIRSQNRNSQVSTARQVAIYVISKVTGLSYTSIGKEFGGRDHSTIVYATNKVKKVMQKDAAYRATVEDLIKNIGNMQ
ncbi:MAG: chromosomal replication initiator protein DnaA [Ruminiclostridium sp.]|nr:chromosomal replication initiator protein DnaA [Ruminiclostridium sp.]MBQ8841188.1 chromosomal replication initiator protein DnaA [Ruminiclostridium sp.]